MVMVKDLMDKIEIFSNGHGGSGSLKGDFVGLLIGRKDFHMHDGEATVGSVKVLRIVAAEIYL